MPDSKPAQHSCRYDVLELQGKLNRLWCFLSILRVDIYV